MRALSLFGLSHWLMVASATKHYLFAGNLFNGSSIHSLEFDDEVGKLSLVKTIEADNSSAWLAFDSRKQNLYSSSLNTTYISSYRINSPTNITFSHRINSQGKCNGTTSAFIQGDNIAPYTVYSASWPGKPACGMAISVTDRGDLSKVIDSWSYANESGVHGISLHRRADGQLFIYSADLNGDSVWTHKVDNSTGKVSLVAQKKTSRMEMHPRHVVVHPISTFAYVVMEKANTVVAFDLDSVSGVVIEAVKEYSLIPAGENNENYWSAEVMLSPSSRYLWVTARAKKDTDYLGYISCFLLSADGTILKRMFMVPTTTRGGYANAVTPAFWSDEYVSLADVPTGYVEIWRMQGRKETPDGVEYETAKSLDKVIIKADGCCANAIWYS